MPTRRPDGVHPPVTRLLDWLERVERALLFLLFAALVLVAVYQILARNFWGGGLGFGDVFVRIAVLWVTVIGALLASRRDSHIRIDLLTRFLSPRMTTWVGGAAALFTGLVAGTFAWYAAQLVALDYADGVAGIGAIPAWVCELILPVGFALIALKYLIRVGAGGR